MVWKWNNEDDIMNMKKWNNSKNNIMWVTVITIPPRSQNKYGGMWERKKGGQYFCRIYMYQRTLVCVPKYYRLTVVTICYHTFIHNINTWFFNFILTFWFEIENTLTNYNVKFRTNNSRMWFIFIWKNFNHIYQNYFTLILNWINQE